MQTKIERRDAEILMLLSKIFVVSASLEILFGPMGFYSSALCGESNFKSVLLFVLLILSFFYFVSNKNCVLCKYDGFLIIGFILLLFIYSDAYEPRFNYYTTFLLATSSFGFIIFNIVKYKKLTNFVLYSFIALLAVFISANFGFIQEGCMSTWVFKGFPSLISLSSSARIGHVFFYPINYIVNFLFYLALLYMISFLYNYKVNKYEINS